MRLAKAILAGTTVLVACAAVFGTVLLLPAGSAFAEETVLALVPAPEIVKWGFASAAAAAALSAIGAGYAVAQVGSAAVGALAEKPELMGRVLVMVGLAEGIAIYGLIVSILILNRLG
jgi:V/A-type H+-transporting ATPase subunit K